MRTPILITLTLLFNAVMAFGQCDYSNPPAKLGIGILEYDTYTNENPIFEVYNDPELTDKFCAWNIYDDNPAPFCAIYHKPAYSIVQVAVLDTLTNSYQVMVNMSDIKYVPKTAEYIFYSWEKYLTQALGVTRKVESDQSKNQFVRQLPKPGSKVVEVPDEPYELLCVMEVQGEWIKVKYDCFYNRDDNPYEGTLCSEYINDCEDSATGWIQWRIGDMVIIDIYLIP